MPRLHLIEIEDQGWCPAPIRDAATDFLQFALHVGNNYEPIAPLLHRVVERSGAHRIIDLCSGGGGPWFRLVEALASEWSSAEVYLTYRYPNLEALRRTSSKAGERLRVHVEPVDATRIPSTLDGFRTMFTAFHHFSPPAARSILEDAVRNGQGIGIFETTERSAKAVLLTALSPLFVLIATPFIRPFRWSRLLWTYLVPIVPLVVLFDGVVSCLRTYSPGELRGLVDGVGAESYQWEIGQVKGRGPVAVTYLIGTPGQPRA